MDVNFDYPDFQGDFYVTGRASFPPMAVESEFNIVILDADSGEEIPSKIDMLETWPGGSLLEAEINFPANSSRRRNYIVAYGENTARKKVFTQTSVLPIVTARIGFTVLAEETMDADVGEMIILVDRSPGFRYYWHIIPIFLIILATIYRTRKNIS